MKNHSIIKSAALIALLAIGTVSRTEAQSSPGQADPAKRIEREANQNQRNQDRIAQERLGTQPAMQPQKVNKASNVIGMKVENASGEKLGTIKDLVLDLESGKVAYTVLAVDGGILHAERLHAVPLEAFQRSADGEHLTLNADKAKLTQAAGFARDVWPSVQNPSWGAEPFWKKRGSAGIEKYETDKPNPADPSKPGQTPVPDRRTPENNPPK